jgi:hypothetical protein
MDILRHTRVPGTSLYEWCNSFSPLIRAFLRISQDVDLGTVEQHRVSKCITAQITDFEQSVLVQANDKWRLITLADGAFDLDELKKDISAADAKFAGRKYKPTALILEYLMARASKQNVHVPSFVTEKSPSATKKRVSEGITKRPMKRFNAKRQRPVFHTEHESWEDDEDHPQLEEDWEEDQSEGDDSTCWDSFAFHQKSTFPHCSTQFCKDRNIAHTPLEDTCHFCKQAGNYKVQCPKYAALTFKTDYQRIRAKLPNEKVYVYDMLWARTFVAIVSAVNATGKPVHLQSSLFFSMKPQGVSSMTACGTWSPRRNRAIPLCPRKFFCKHMDKMATAGMMMTARMENMATSMRKETLLKRVTDSAATWWM